MANIQFPITVTGIEWADDQHTPSRYAGSWVKIRPCDPELKDKTFLGVYLDDLLTSPMVSLYRDVNATGPAPKGPVRKGTLKVIPMRNPAIYVPDLKRVVWGRESWWGIITTPEELRQISDADIQNVWYVRAMADLVKAAPKVEKGPK